MGLRMPKEVTTGSYLEGGLCLGSSDLPEQLRKAVQYPCRYSVAEWNKARGQKKSTLSTVEIKSRKEKSKKFDEADLKESVRDHQIQLLSKITDGDYGERLFQQLAAENSTHLPLLMAQIKCIVRREQCINKRLEGISQLASRILECANPDEVLKFMGIRIENSQADLLARE